MLGTVKRIDNLKLECGSASVQGTRHEQNEDCALMEPAAGIFAVADGIGGYEGGAEASELVSTIFLGEIVECEPETLDKGEVLSTLRSAERKALLGMKCLASACPSLRDMGTTLTLGWLVDDLLHVAHAGDSRLYLLRGGRLSRKTTDHSFVEELRQKGHLSSSEAAASPFRNVVTRSLSVSGASENLEFQSIPVLVGDRFLFLTDGISDALRDKAIESAAKLARSPNELSAWLVQSAKSSGATDDLTCVVLDITG